MNHPTEDTPLERDAKADALEKERRKLAKALALELVGIIGSVRWEIRGLYAAVLFLTALHFFE